MELFGNERKCIESKGNRLNFMGMFKVRMEVIRFLTIIWNLSVTKCTPLRAAMDIRQSRCVVIKGFTGNPNFSLENLSFVVRLFLFAGRAARVPLTFRAHDATSAPTCEKACRPLRQPF